MVGKLLPPPERVKLTSELLIDLERLLPFYEGNRPDYEVKKIKSEIRKHKLWLASAEADLRKEANDVLA